MPTMQEFNVDRKTGGAIILV